MNLEKDTRLHGIVSAFLGAFAMVAWLIPLLGAASSVTAVITGLQALSNEEDGWPIAGLALGCVGVLLTVLRSGLVYIYG